MMKRILVLLFLLSLGLTQGYAQRPDAPPYAVRGDYAVGTQVFKLDDPDRPLDITIWYPADNSEGVEEQVAYAVGMFTAEGRAIADAPPLMTDAPYPLIVFSHGSGGTRYQSYFYTEHLASLGFVVVAMDHPGNTLLDLLGDDETFAANITTNFALRPLDMLRGLDWAANLTAADGALAGLIDMEHVGVTGHSFGGYTSLSVAGGQLDLSQAQTACGDDNESNFCQNVVANLAEVATLRGLEVAPEGAFPPTLDERVDAMVLLAPASGFSMNAESVAAITLPSLIIVGSADETTPADVNANVTYEQLGSPFKMLATLENAGHYIFLESCPEIAITFGLFDSCSDDVWDMSRAHDLTNHLASAFFLATLKNDEDAREALRAENLDFTGVEIQITAD